MRRPSLPARATPARAPIAGAPGAVSARPASGRVRAGGRRLAVGPDDVVQIRRAGRLAARQRPLHRARQALGLGGLALRGPLGEPGHDLGGEQLEALADVLVTVVPAWETKITWSTPAAS